MKDNLSCDNFPELQTPVSFSYKPMCSVLTSEKPPYHLRHSNAISWIVFHCFTLAEATRPPANAAHFIVLMLISECTLRVSRVALQSDVPGFEGLIPDPISVHNDCLSWSVVWELCVLPCYKVSGEVEIVNCSLLCLY